MYQVIIDRTAKRAGNKDNYSRYDQVVKEVATLEDVKNMLFGGYDYAYNKKTRLPMFSEPDSRHAGYIYRYKASECSRETGKWETYYYQDWVTVYELVKKEVLDY